MHIFKLIYKIHDMDIGHHCEFAHGWVCARPIGKDTLFISFKGKGAIIEVDYCPKCGYSYQPEGSNRKDLNQCVLCKSTIRSTIYQKDDVCEDCHYKIVKQIHSQCATKNSEKTH